jgi:hypothetical protein
MERDGAIWEVSDLVLAAFANLTAAATNGRWASMAQAVAMNVLLIKAPGAATEHPVINLQQARDATGTGAKTLQLKRVQYKVGAALNAAADRWVSVASITPLAPANSYDTTGIVAGDKELVLASYVLPNDLDVAGGFTHLRMQVSDPGVTAQWGAIIYVPSARFYKGKPAQSLLA